MNDDLLNKVYVILWHYGDGSAFGVVRAYRDLVDAERDLAMLKQHSESRQFRIEETPCL